MSRHSPEIGYLKKLIWDFPSRFKPSEASEAYNVIAARFQSLEQNIDSFTVFQKLDTNMPDTLRRFAFSIHSFLFIDILSNAGEIRSVSDPNGGHIYFGGQKHQQYRSRFHGSIPSKIEQELTIAFSYLKVDPSNPVKQALRFYQHFVKIHPFYDANGRIGRLIVSIYLYSFGRYVLWAKFDGPKNAQFIKKLNNCHKRLETGHRLEQYFTYLYGFFNKYVVRFDELKDFDG